MLPWMDVEAEVLALLRAGDAAAAAAAAIGGYGPALHGYVVSLLPDPDAAGDVFGQIQEDVLRGLGGFRGECSLRAWLFRVAFHAVARHRRDPYRARGERFASALASRLPAPAASSLMPGSRRDLLRRLRAGLDPEDETLLALRIDRELEWEEIAAVLAQDRVDTTSAALRKRFERLKDRLARAAREQGLLE